jgi:hypothetical protein
MLGRLRFRPVWLEVIYQAFDGLIKRLDPVIRNLGYQRVDRWVYSPEKIAKSLIFGCEMCGQCTLHNTGMTCPMTCPKHLRNGPCGGVRIDTTCEVDPNLICVWVEAYDIAARMMIYGSGINSIQPPLNHCLYDRSAFINVLCCEDDKMPPSWLATTEPAIVP